MKKALAVFIIMTLLFTGSYSEIKNDVIVLSLEDATRMSVEHNYSFKMTLLDKLRIGRQIDTLKNNINAISSSAFITNTDKKDRADPLIDSLVTLDNSVFAIEDGEVLQRAVISDTIQNLFITIRKLEEQKRQLEIQEQLNEKVLKLDRKKSEIGLLSKIELEKKFNSNMKVVRQRQSVDVEITKLMVNLKEFAGIGRECQIELDYSFIDAYAVVPLETSYGKNRLFSSNLKIDLLKKNYDRIRNNFVDIKERYPKGADELSNNALDLQKAEIQYNDAVKVLPFKYESAYQNVIERYNVYQHTIADIHHLEKEYNVVILKYNLGQASKIECDVLMATLAIEKSNLFIARLDYVASRTALESVFKGTN